MKNTFFYLLAFFPMLLFSQEDDSYKLDYNNTRNAAELCTRYKSNGFISNAEADNALGKILSVVGASKRFIVAPCENINNALAITDDGMRYILYDPEFINSISETSNYWANMSILAHEVGHHINGHTLGASMSAYENRIQELEADEFSGFVMQKIGATLEQAIDAIASLASSGDDSYSSHPNKERRTKAITKGFDNAKNNSFVSEKKLTDWEEYYFRGDEKYEAEDYEGAIEDFTESIKLKPDAKAYYKRARAKEMIDDYQGSKYDLIRSIELHPKQWEVYYHLGRLQYYFLDDDYGALASLENYFDQTTWSSDYYDMWAGKIMAGALFNKGFYPKALEYINYVIDDTEFETVIDDESRSFFYVEKGKINFELGNLDIAKKDFEKAAELDTKSAYNIEMLGDTYAKEKNYEKAIEFYNKALKLDPAKFSIYEYRAYAHEALEDYFSALLDMNEAIKHNPDYGHLYFKRGEYSLKMGDQEKACAGWLLGNEKGNTDSYNKLLETCGYSKEDFYTADDYYNDGRSEKEAGNFADAILLFNKAIEMGSSENIYGQLVLCYQGLGQFDISLEMLNKYNAEAENEKYVNTVWALNTLGYAKRMLKDYAGSIKVAEEFINSYKINPDALDYSLDTKFIEDNFEECKANYFNYFMSLKDSASYEKAIDVQNKWLKIIKILEYDKTYEAITYYRLAEVKKLTEDYYGAIQDVNEYIKTWPEEPWGFKLRGEIKIAIGGSKSACEDFNKSLEFSLKDENEGDEVQKEIQKLIDDNCK